MYYDSHTHLNDEILYPEWKKYLLSFVKQWGEWLVNIGVNYDWNIKAIQIAKDSKDINCIVKSSIWYHPIEVIDQNISQKDFEQAMNDLKKLYNKNKEFIVGIGETGIDMHYEKSPWTEDEQKELFALHCDLAQELDLPVIVHSRDWFEETFDVLKNYKNLKIYLHCRGYWPEELKKIDKTLRNYFIWFAGNLTYPKALELKESLKIVDLNKLVLETDAPYLAPQKKRGTTNEPIFIKYIYDYVGELLTPSPENLQNQLKINFKSLYDL